MHRMHHRLRKKPAAYTGLVGDDDHRYAGIVEAANGIGGEGKHTKLADIIQVADFFGDGAVAIEKNGRARQRGLRQDPPPRTLARTARRQSRWLEILESCNDDRWGSGARSTD